MLNIATSQELIDAIKDLITPIDTPTQSLGVRMEPSEANNMFSEIETSFNKLYEKLRLLEDIDKFTKLYIQSEFKKAQSAISKTAIDADVAEDLYKDTTIAARSVSFQAGTTMLDRDGSPIATADCVDDTTLIPDGTNLSSANIVSMAVTSNDVPYRQIKSKPENYRTFYVCETPVRSGVEEKIRFFFPQATTVNFCQMSSFASNIDKISLIREDDQVIPLSEDNYVFVPQRAKGIEITLRSTSIYPIDLYISEDKDTSNELTKKYRTSVLDSIFNTCITQKGDTYGVYK